MPDAASAIGDQEDHHAGCVLFRCTAPLLGLPVFHGSHHISWCPSTPRFQCSMMNCAPRWLACSSWVSSPCMISHQPTTGSLLLPLETPIVPFLSNCT